MSSAVVKQTNSTDCTSAIEHWRHFPFSSLAHHGRACCDAAREWVIATDFSQLNGESPLTGPRWIRHKFKWGPSRWPMYWCEAVEQKTLDCGALASLAHELYRARGVRSFPAQFIQLYTDEATRHWREQWGASSCSVHWLRGELIYHEGCAVSVRGDEISLWDASAGWWVNPRQTGGYGGLVALRIHDPETTSGAPHFKWGAHRVPANVWHEVGAKALTA